MPFGGLVPSHTFCNLVTRLAPRLSVSSHTYTYMAKWPHEAHELASGSMALIRNSRRSSPAPTVNAGMLECPTPAPAVSRCRAAMSRPYTWWLERRAISLAKTCKSEGSTRSAMSKKGKSSSKAKGPAQTADRTKVQCNTQTPYLALEYPRLHQLSTPAVFGGVWQMCAFL